MRAAHLGRFLLGLGLAVGVLATVALALGFEPARLPAALLNIAAYKLTFLAAFGLLAAGAVVQRYARRASERAAAVRANEALPPTARHASSEPRAAVPRPERSSDAPAGSQRRS